MPDPLPAPRLLDQRDFLLFWFSRWTASLAVMIESVTLQWQVYDIARTQMDVKRAAFMVSLLGLITFIPVFLLALPAGETADRHARKRIMAICETGEILTIAVLAVTSFLHLANLPLLLGVALVFGVMRSFFSPASTAMGPMLVPKALLPRAIAWNSLAGQTASIAGPALGGVLCAISPALSFVVCMVLYLISAVALFLIRGQTRPQVQPGSRWELVKEGLSYVWTNKIVFGAISLDLFAVLLGGATALLPVYARDVLNVGPQGFGVLRASVAVGAGSVAIWLSIRPIHRKAGVFMFSGVAMFGAATGVFALSKWLALSVLALAVLGGADMLSVYVRQTLVQIVTPDQMRGRVAAVSTLFIGASNELGEFESGVVARLLGPIGAALFGGVGALIVTGVWAKLFPALRKADRLA